MHASAEGRAALLVPAADPPPPRHELAAPGITRTDAGYFLFNLSGQMVASSPSS